MFRFPYITATSGSRRASPGVASPWIRALAPGLLLLLLAQTTPRAEAQESDNDRLVKMLEGYQELLKKPEVANRGKDQPREDWRVISQSINKGFLRFVVSPDENSILKGVLFRAVPDSETTHIIFTRRFITAWEKRPALAYSLLAKRLHEVAFFFRNPNLWQKVRRNAMEQTFITLDDYNLMSHLILYRLSPLGFEIGELEQFVLDSFKEDNLAGVMLFMERISLQVAIVLNQLSTTYEENLEDKGIRRDILKLGRSLLDVRRNLPADAHDVTVYSHAVGIHSWLELTPHIVSLFHNFQRPENPLEFDKIMELEPEYSALRQELEAERIRDTPIMNHVARETIEGFEEL